MEKYQNNLDDIRALIEILPGKLPETVESKGHLDSLIEIVMDLGRPALARYTNEEIQISDLEVTQADIDYIVSKIGNFDLDNRAGMERTLHRISCIRNRKNQIVGLTCRVGRAVFGTLEIIRDYIESGKSILILGKPGIGKTTMLREAARVLAEKKRVIIVDTSNEIGGDGDVPHPAVGKARRMQVSKPALQHEVMIEAVENHNPEVIIIDEIGRELEAEAARTIAERGVQLVGTAHGQTIGNLLMNPTLSDLIGGIESVTLSDEEAKRRGTQKTVLERKSPPTFDVLVEIKERNWVYVYPDVGEAVDNLVRGIEFYPESRKLLPDGRIIKENAPSPVLEGVGHAADLSEDQSSERHSRSRSNIVEICGMNPENSEKKYDSRKNDKKQKNLSDDSDQDDLAENGQKGIASLSDGKPVRILPYGVSHKKLIEAASRIQVPVAIVNNIEDADLMMTLRAYYRNRQEAIIEAEEKDKPIYVLRSNTTNQMEYSLANIFNIEVPTEATDWEDVEDETVSAIRSVLNGDVSWVDLSPADSSIRRIQQKMIENANLSSQSFGKEPRRRIRIYRNN